MKVKEYNNLSDSLEIWFPENKNSHLNRVYFEIIRDSMSNHEGRSNKF